MNENMVSSCEFRPLKKADIPLMVAAFTEIGWTKLPLTFQKYLEDQDCGERHIWVAFRRDAFLGYVTLKWHSDYQPFADKNIPEINDLNVLPSFRRQGIGSKLLDFAEVEAQKKGLFVGLGVGLYADYGAAQKLYVKRGYVPDGCGITHKNEPVRPGSTVRVDDDLVLWFVKKLNKKGIMLDQKTSFLTKKLFRSQLIHHLVGHYRWILLKMQ